MECQACMFFNQEKTECRRYAPSPSDDASKAEWPTVARTDWCGEFKSREEAQSQQVA